MKSSSTLSDEIICSKIFDGKINSKSNIFDDVENEKKKKKRVECKKNWSRDLKSRLREDADQLWIQSHGTEAMLN